MKKRSKKIVLIISVGLLVALVSFLSLSDIGRAKVSLKVLGVNKENTANFLKVTNLIKNNKHTYCLDRNEVLPKHVNLIENYFNKELLAKDSLKWQTISDIYASKGERWNSGCTGWITGEPHLKFKYLIYSEKSLIICFESGGIVRSTWCEFYEINSDAIDLVGAVNSVGPSMLNLALQLKFNKRMYEWKSMDKETVPTQLEIGE